MISPRLVLRSKMMSRVTAKLLNRVRVALLALFVILFYLLPWCPFLIGAFWLDGWSRLMVFAVGAVGPFVQAIAISWFFGCD
jgi:hypothetical protein